MFGGRHARTWVRRLGAACATGALVLWGGGATAGASRMPFGVSTSPNAIIGTWEGTLVQPGYPHYFGIVRVWRRGSRYYGVSDYPYFPCAGVLRGSQTSRVTFLFAETITTGRNRCVSDDRIRVGLLSATSAAWVWTTTGNRALAASYMRKVA